MGTDAAAIPAITPATANLGRFWATTVATNTCHALEPKKLALTEFKGSRGQLESAMLFYLEPTKREEI